MKIFDGVETRIIKSDYKSATEVELKGVGAWSRIRLRQGRGESWKLF